MWVKGKAQRRFSFMFFFFSCADSLTLIAAQLESLNYKQHSSRVAVALSGFRS